MRNSYFNILPQLLLLTGLGIVGTSVAQAQNLNFATSSASITTSSFSILGTNATAIVVADEDDANSSAQNIGFTFRYNGQAFTQFVLNTNGALKLGSTAPSDELTDFFNSTSAADVNMLFPLFNDLVGSSATNGFRLATTGTAPNRVCTVQWTDMTEFDSPEQFDNFTFQVKLYETSNVIEFVYGPSTPGAGTAALSIGGLGLKGSGPATGQVLLASKAANVPWTSPAFQNTNYTLTGQLFEYDKNSLPAVGLTYRFTPTVTSTKDAQLAKAISVYPSPSNGDLTLAVRGAAATLQVEVVNTLGQRVYTGFARDNFNTPLNLTHLSAGLYHVKVMRGNSYALQTITIQK